MPHSVASDQVLHCLPMSHKKEARLIWVNEICFSPHKNIYNFNEPKMKNMSPKENFKMKTR